MHSRHIGRIVLSLAMLLVCLALLGAAATSVRASSWSGTVTNQDGDPLPRITVTMNYLVDEWLWDWQTVMVTVSGADGRYLVSHGGYLRENWYELTFHDPTRRYEDTARMVGDGSDWGTFTVDVIMVAVGSGSDVTPPVTSDGGDHGWATTSGGLNMDFRVRLTATDDLSGVAGTWYRGSGQTDWTRGTTIDFLIAADHRADGIYRYEYYSADFAGNVETPKTGCVRVDTTEPAATVAAEQTSHGALLLSVADNLSPTCDVRIEVLRPVGRKHRSSGSGVVAADFTVQLAADGSTQSVALPDGLSARPYLVSVTATDLAGNTQSVPATGAVRLRN